MLHAHAPTLLSRIAYLDRTVSCLARPRRPLKRARRANVGTIRLKNGAMKKVRAGRRRDRMSVELKSGRPKSQHRRPESSGVRRE